MAWGSGAFNSCDKLLERVEKNDPTLKELVILPMKTFGAKDLDRLSAAIENGVNTHLISISASGHKLPPNSLQTFGNALSAQAIQQSQQQQNNNNNNHHGIKSLAIGSKDMGNEGVIALCRGLAPTNGAMLHHLDLGWKEIGIDGLFEIGRTFGHSEYLTQLDLSRNDFGSEGIVQLSRAVAEGTKGNDNDDDNDAVVVAFPALEQLILSECNIDSTGMDVLAKILLGKEGSSSSNNNNNNNNNNKKKRRSKRIHLAIGSNPIGSAGCHSLVQLLSSGTDNDDDDDTQHGSSVISHLQAAQCSIGNDGMDILSSSRGGCHHHSGLEIMDLSDNDITTDGAKIFAQSLLRQSWWPDLVELKLAKNTEIGSEGVSAILGALVARSDTGESSTDSDNKKKKNSSLQNLDLSYTNCGAEGAKAALRSGGLHTLRLFGNTIGSDGFDAIAPLLQGGHPSIENLDLGGNNAEEDSVVRLLDSIADKKKDDDDDSTPPQSNNNKLAVLEIGGNKFGDKAMEALTRLQSVWPDLDVAHDKPVGESGWKEEDQD